MHQWKKSSFTYDRTSSIYLMGGLSMAWLQPCSDRNKEEISLTVKLEAFRIIHQLA